jgi:ribosomal protein L11 methyltransferase
VTAWKISATVPAAAAARFDSTLADALVDDGLVVSTVETSRDGPWRSDVFGDSDDSAGPDPRTRERIAHAIAAAAQAAGIATPPWAVEILPDIDWVAENQRSFQPFRVGPFWVHPSHDPGVPPRDTIALRIDAGLAFGTGTHATTRGCLEAIARLPADAAGRAVDVGCGSGILAIAMARLWRQPVLAGDNDPQAVAVARDNAVLNGVGALCAFHVADGLDAAPLAAAAPYGAIVANILAQPLIDLAPAFARALAPDGTLVLAGLLAEQADEVSGACAAHGLAVVDSIVHETGQALWPTLMLRFRR